MDNQQTSPAWSSTQAPQLKESIRDMIQLQQNHLVPDELFWEIFNARVLLNQPIDVNTFFSAQNTMSGRA